MENSGSPKNHGGYQGFNIEPLPKFSVWQISLKGCHFVGT
ncbi:unnamed protein product [Rhodiola kirilowii]